MFYASLIPSSSTVNYMQLSWQNDANAEINWMEISTWSNKWFFVWILFFFCPTKLNYKLSHQNKMTPTHYILTCAASDKKSNLKYNNYWFELRSCSVPSKNANKIPSLHTGNWSSKQQDANAYHTLVINTKIRQRIVFSMFKYLMMWRLIKKQMATLFDNSLR